MPYYGAHINAVLIHKLEILHSGHFISDYVVSPNENVLPCPGISNLVEPVCCHTAMSQD